LTGFLMNWTRKKPFRCARTRKKFKKKGLVLVLVNINTRKGEKRIKRDSRGAILVPLAVFIIGLIAASALAIDFAMMTSYKRAVQNVAEMMAIGAMGYHTDENFDKKVANLTLTQQHQAKAMLGMRNAFLVWGSTKNSLAKAGQFLDPFGGVGWNGRFQLLMNDLTDRDPANDAAHLDLSSYLSGNVRFLQKSAGGFVEPADITAVTDPLLIRAVKNQVNTTSSGFTSILARYFGFPAFKVTGSATAEVKNTGKTNSVVLLIDRSISMAGLTDPDAYLQPGQAGYNEAYPGLTINDLTKMQNAAFTIQPMTDMLYAARIVPKILGRSNWFNDDVNRNSSLAIIAFDLAAESVGAPSGPNGHLDRNTSAGSDNYNNAYKLIQDRINPHVPVLGRPGLPELAGLCVDPKRENCMQCFTAGCKALCNADAVAKDDIFHSITEAKCFQFNGYGTALPTSELDSFFPWTYSNESQGLEVAIELLRQVRKKFYDDFPALNVDEEFQPQIILFSDGFINAFHDMDHVSDAFPKYNFAIFSHSCDQDIFHNHEVRTGANMLDPGQGQSINQATKIPIAWRKDFNAASDMKPAVTWVASCSAGGGSCPDRYHNGTALYANLLPAGQLVYSPADASVPAPVGIWSSSITDAGLAGNPCPSVTCNKVIVDHSGNSVHDSPGDTTRKLGITLFCPHLHFMDHVKWAYANNIIINSVGFGDIGPAYLKATPDSTMRRQFLLTYAADPKENGVKAGFFLTNVNCGSAGTGCPGFESALKRSLTSFEAKLK